MKVKALRLFNDLKSKKLRKAGEIFEVSEKRAGELSSAHNGTLIEVIKEKTPKGGEGDAGGNKERPANKKRKS